MEMEFVLLNGEKHPVSLDVTDAIRVTQGATHKIIHIEVEIELPEVIGNGRRRLRPRPGGMGGTSDVRHPDVTDET